MPPHFEDCHVTTMKHTMLPRMPECRFTEDDYTRLTASTKLSRAQIEVWATNLRYRFKDPVKCEAYLKNTEKEKFTGRARRYFLTAFDLSDEVVKTMTFPRAGAAGAAAGQLVKIKFLVWAFKPESNSANCYIEFEEQLSVSTMIARLEELGAAYVLPITFDNTTDGTQSAVDAVKSIVDIGLRTGLHYKTGSPTNGSMEPHCIRLDNNNGGAPDSPELSEKTAQGILASLRDVGSSVASEVHKRGDATDLNINNMQSEIVQRLDVQGGQVAEIALVTNKFEDCLAAELVLKNRTIELLNSQLAHERQFNEQKYACLTTELDLKNKKIKELEEQLEDKIYKCNVQEQKTATKSREITTLQAAKTEAVAEKDAAVAELDAAKKTTERLRAIIRRDKANIDRQDAAMDRILRSDTAIDCLLRAEEVINALNANNKRVHDIADDAGSEDEDDEDEPDHNNKRARDIATTDAGSADE